MNQGTSIRFCPACGTETTEPLCPRDQNRTFVKPNVEQRSMVFAPGEVVLGRYRISRLIGKGGFAEVYAGEHTGTLVPVALKVMLPQALSDEVNVRRFFREAQITAGLKHENTVRVIDVDQSEQGYPFLAMELLEGPTLEAWLRAEAAAGRMPDEAFAVRIGIQILSSLEEAHSHLLVHRDLKPANIMLIDSANNRLRIKVLDFGAAHVTSAGVTTRSSSLGTPDYMSPEQCRSAEVDGRSDLYAVGAILYRCMAGAPPFVAPDAMSVMYQHANQLPRSLRETAATPVSPAFVAVVMKTLAKDPRDRFQSATEMRVALEETTGAAVPEVGASFAAPRASDRDAGTRIQQRPSLLPIVLWGSIGLVLLGIGATVLLAGGESTTREASLEPVVVSAGGITDPPSSDLRPGNTLGLVAQEDPYQMRAMMRWDPPAAGGSIPAPQVEVEVLRGTQALPLAATRARSTTGTMSTEYVESNPAGAKRTRLSLSAPGAFPWVLDVVAEVGDVGRFRAACNVQWEAGRGYVSDGGFCVLRVEPPGTWKPVASPGPTEVATPGKRLPEKSPGAATTPTPQGPATGVNRAGEGRPILRPLDDGDPWSKPAPGPGAMEGEGNSRPKLEPGDPWRKGK